MKDDRRIPSADQISEMGPFPGLADLQTFLGRRWKFVQGPFYKDGLYFSLTDPSMRRSVELKFPQEPGQSFLITNFYHTPIIEMGDVLQVKLVDKNKKNERIEVQTRGALLAIETHANRLLARLKVAGEDTKTIVDFDREFRQPITMEEAGL